MEYLRITIKTLRLQLSIPVQKRLSFAFSRYTLWPMRHTVREFNGTEYSIIWSETNSPISLSIIPATGDSSRPPLYGCLAYATPFMKQGTSTTTLVPSADQDARDTAIALSQLLASKFDRPVFVNSSVGSTHPSLFKHVCDTLSEVFQQAQLTVA